jgi:hypothetical protein
VEFGGGAAYRLYLGDGEPVMVRGIGGKKEKGQRVFFLDTGMAYVKKDEEIDVFQVKGSVYPA